MTSHVLPLVLLALLLPSPAHAANGSVTVADFSFTPTTVTIKAGESVTWTRASAQTADHTLTTESGDWSPLVTTPVTRKFSTAGTFAYWCKNHGAKGSGMHGTVVAQAPSPSPKPSPTKSKSPSPKPSPSPAPKPSKSPTVAPTTAAPTTAAPSPTRGALDELRPPRPASQTPPWPSSSRCSSPQPPSAAVSSCSAAGPSPAESVVSGVNVSVSGPVTTHSAAFSAAMSRTAQRLRP